MRGPPPFGVLTSQLTMKPEWKIDFLASVVDVDPDQVARDIVISTTPSEISRLSTVNLSEKIDVARIR
jgi:hypothetical protein